MIRLAVVGTGGMGSGHVRTFQSMRGCKVVACCDATPGRAQEVASQLNVPAAYDDVDEMLNNEELDAVSVATTDRSHCEVSLKVISHGIPVMCEKPLADSLKNAKKMASAAARKRVLTAVNFSYRNSFSTQKAAALVADGKLGRIIHVEGSYLQTWLTSTIWGEWRKKPAWLWRLSTKHGSAGTLGDIGVHLYDLAHFVVGDFAQLSCELKTFDKGVKRIGEYVFDANDSMITTVRFKNGAIGSLSSTRWATGHANTVTIRVYGDKAAIDLNLDRPPESQLRMCVGNPANWKDVKCPKTPDMYTRFINSVKTGVQAQTSFKGGAIVQSYLDASMRSSKTGTFVKV